MDRKEELKSRLPILNWSIQTRKQPMNDMRSRYQGLDVGISGSCMAETKYVEILFVCIL